MSMTLQASLEIGNVFESGRRILWRPRPFKNDILYRTIVCENTYRHHTIPTARISGQHFVLEVDIRVMKQVKGGFETCLAPGTNTRPGIRRAVKTTRFRYEIYTYPGPYSCSFRLIFHMVG